MLFNKKDYINEIKILDNFSYIICTIIFLLISSIGFYILEIKGLITGIIISCIITFRIYIKIQIKVDEMKWKIDIYNMIEKIKSDK